MTLDDLMPMRRSEHERRTIAGTIPMSRHHSSRSAAWTDLRSSVVPPEGSTATEAFLLLKWVDDRGQQTWTSRMTDTVNLEEILGALNVQIATITERLVDDSRASTRHRMGADCAHPIRHQIRRSEDRAWSEPTDSKDES
jgi:hypothetical protein